MATVEGTCMAEMATVVKMSRTTQDQGVVFLVTVDKEQDGWHQGDCDGWGNWVDQVLQGDPGPEWSETSMAKPPKGTENQDGQQQGNQGVQNIQGG